MLLLLSLTACTALDEAGNFFGGLTDSLLGGEDNAEPPAELVDYTPEITIDEIWSEGVGDGYDELTVKLVPAISDTVIFAGDRSGLIEAREIETGKLIWSIDTELPLSAGPGTGLETVIVGSSNADVLAMNSETGEIRWRAKVSSEVLSVPVVADGKVIIRTTDGKLIVLSEDNGEEVWGFERNVPPLSIRGIGTPLVDGENVISGYSNGKLYALRLQDGKQSWETSVAIPQGRSEVERLVDLDADPVKDEDVIYTSSYQGGIIAVLKGDGDILWQSEDVSSHTGFSLDWRYLYTTDTSSDVWQLDQRNGAALWKQKELHQRQLTAPVSYQDYILVGDLEGYVHWLSNEDGRQLGRIQITDSPIKAKPVIRDDVVYVYATDGTLAALKVKQVVTVVE